MITYSPAEGQDTLGAKKLIDSSGLPLEGLESARLLVAKDGSQIVGTAALEIHASKGLLRSVAVREDYQGKDIGRNLVREVEKQAREIPLTELVLLTLTAPGFFRKLGYREIPRESVGGPVTDSVEFISCCPDSATCMIKRLT